MCIRDSLACRAALAVLDILEQDEVIAANRRLAARINRRCEALRHHPQVKHFRNTGMIWAFDVADAAPGFAQDFYRRAIEAGVLLRPLGNTVYWMPPYVIDDEGIELLVGTVEKLLSA